LLTFTAALAAYGQFRPQPFDAELKAHLTLTDEQVARIQRNNADATQRRQEDFTRIARLRIEAGQELAKPSPNAMEVGRRFAEIETTCRSQSQASTRARQLNLAVLNDAQKAKLRALEEGLRLTAVADEAESANLYRRPALSILPFPLPGGTGGVSGTFIFDPASIGPRGCGGGLGISSLLPFLSPNVIP